MRLLDYAKDVNTQHGEDGIFEKILETLPVKDKWCVEFGAWDGIYLSNVAELIDKKGYSAVLIEPDKERFTGLVKNRGGKSNITILNQFVGFTPEENLAHILVKTPIPKNFDLLSVYIEGNDYYIWKVLKDYTPKVIHISYNPTIPTEVDFVQPSDPSVNQGASLLALTRLGKEKGYELVCANHNSAMFVQAQYFPLFNIANNDPRILRENFDSVTYLFAGYDGTLFVTGRGSLPHHFQIRIQNRLAQLPKFFRSYPRTYGPAKAFLYKIYWRLARLLGRA